jgi:hypothetical protein
VHGQCHGGGKIAAVESRDGVARAQESLGGCGGAARIWRWHRGVAET